ncbi:helix-turn-helix transcriptional regulator [Fructobacillus sp. CRL 2054]|uniref:helix-turn-helix domain-containing protein n=1 Tax=Fructobacillus sp. CRL 2054 TaxID=2763007 RepID=UPI002379950A|nr:helix-turn-helix transcriptional regulator [Fructobacillus sp. CRL 2054]MDD9139172.1 helix-turn-helix transcriptional regulator [Fructobacillus sp. CRL 2054]
MTLLDNAKRISKLRGISLKEVAVKAGLGENSIYSWDRSSPKAENLQKVADVLNVSTDYLLGRTTDMNKFDSDNKTTDILDENVILAFNGMEIPDEDRQKLLQYAQYVMDQRQQGKKGKIN